MRIAVAGGTGWTGRLVVDALRAGGDEPVVLARSAGVDLTTGGGLDAMLAGVEAVVDVTNVTTTRAAASVAFFESVTSTLLAAEQRAGIGHHVALSIVGTDRVDLGYYQGKRRQEELVLGAGTGTVLRATQFHEFALQLLDRPEAGGRDAIDGHAAHRSGEVAGALVGLAECEPRGMAPQVTGPWVESMVDVMRRLLRAGGSRLAVLSPRLQGAAFAEMASGDLLPTKPGDRGSQSWDE
jgi:uncharacterized protein YbjT (DUF2867 family)